MHVVERVGQPQQLVGGAAEQLGHPARDRHGDEAQVAAERLAPGAAEAAAPAQAGEEAERAVAGRPLRDALADGVHPADDLEARRVRHGHREARDAGADVDVEVVEGGRVDAQDDLAGTRLRVRHVLDAQHLGPAELVEAQGSHRASLAESSRDHDDPHR